MSGRLEGYPGSLRASVGTPFGCNFAGMDEPQSEELELLGSADYVKVPHVPETFLISMYPPTAENYWEAMIKSGAHVGVQLEQSGVPYHLAVGGSITLGFGTIHLVNKRNVGRLVTEREYVLTDSEGKTRSFIHYCLIWEDYSIPQGAAFAEIMSAYRDKIQSLIQKSIPNPKVHIHCRAGRGRSGTFAFARSLECQPAVGGVSGEVLLETIREQRGGLVESALQEQFAYSSVRGFDSYGKLSALCRYSAEGRISWIGANGLVEAMGFGKQLLVWVASALNLRRWAIRHLMDFDGSLNRMLELRNKVLPLSLGQPSLTHRYWQCWELFRKTFDLSSEELSNLHSKEPEAINLNAVVQGSTHVVDIAALLDHYNHPLELFEAYISQGMLGQALWIMEKCSIDLEKIKGSLDPQVYDWFLLQKKLRVTSDVPFESIAHSSYVGSDKKTHVGLGLGTEAATRWFAAKKRGDANALSPFPVSDFEIRVYIKAFAPPHLLAVWECIINNMQQLSKTNKEMEDFFHTFKKRMQPSDTPVFPRDVSDFLILKRQQRDEMVSTTGYVLTHLKKMVNQILTQHPFMTPELEKWLKLDPKRKVVVFACDTEEGFKPEQGVLLSSTPQQVSSVIAQLLAKSLPFQIGKLDIMNPDQSLDLPPMPLWLETVPAEAETAPSF